MTNELLRKLEAAKGISRAVAAAPAQQRSQALLAMADELLAGTDEILAANRQDIGKAQRAGVEPKRIRILTISQKDIFAMADYFRLVAAQADPVGRLLEETVKDDMRREKRLFPLGVVAMVSEARSSVVTDCAALCLRSGNVLLFRGSSHSEGTDGAIVACLQQALVNAGMPAQTVTMISGGGHELTYELAQKDRLIDLMILRGGYGCLEDIKRYATVPIVGAGPGNCHIYIDESAQKDMALAIVRNSKVPRPLACNAAETILVNRNWAEEALHGLLDMLTEHGIRIYGCPGICRLCPEALPAEQTDWEREYFAPAIAVKLVDDTGEAIDHINRYRTPHTECIITENEINARLFQTYVEANVVCWNASTRLTDGMEFGMGGEMGISTQKYPVGGPIGMLHLMQQKYFISGNGTLR